MDLRYSTITHTHTHTPTLPHMLPPATDSFIQEWGAGDPKTEPPCGHHILGPGPRGAADISNKWCFISRDMVQNSSASQTTRATKMCLCWSDLSCEPIDVQMLSTSGLMQTVAWTQNGFQRVESVSSCGCCRSTVPKTLWLIYDKSIVDLTLV